MSTVHYPPPATAPRPLPAPPPSTARRGPQPSGIHASWGTRAGALLIDWAITAAASLLCYTVAFALLASPSTMQAGLVVLFATYLVGPIIWFALYCWQLCRSGQRNGQTIGKAALNIRILRADGHPVTFVTVLLRHVVIGVFYLLTLGVGIIVDYLWPLWDQRSQSLHDKIAGTYVVRTADGPPAPPVVAAQPDLAAPRPASAPSVLLPPVGLPRRAPATAADTPTERHPITTRSRSRAPLPGAARPRDLSAPIAVAPAPSATAWSCATCGHTSDAIGRFCPRCGAHSVAPSLPPGFAPEPLPSAPSPAARSWRPALALAGAVMLIALGAAGGAVALSGQPSPASTAGQPPADDAVGGGATVPPLMPASEPGALVPDDRAQGHSEPAAPAPGQDRGAATVAGAAGPAATLRRHFEHLDGGDYDRAFALMTPAYRNASPRWPARRAQAAPAVRVDLLEVARITAADADVQVTFYARDRYRVRGSDTNCRRFSGLVHLRRIDGLWRYDPLANNLSTAVLPPSNSRCP